MSECDWETARHSRLHYVYTSLVLIWVFVPWIFKTHVDTLNESWKEYIVLQKCFWIFTALRTNSDYKQLGHLHECKSVFWPSSVYKSCSSFILPMYSIIIYFMIKYCTFLYFIYHRCRIHVQQVKVANQVQPNDTTDNFFKVLCLDGILKPTTLRTTQNALGGSWTLCNCDTLFCVCVCVCLAYSELSELAGCFWPPEDQSPESESPPSTLPSAAARNRHHTTSYAARKTITI